MITAVPIDDTGILTAFMCAGHFLYPFLLSAADKELSARFAAGVRKLHSDHAARAGDSTLEALDAGCFTKVHAPLLERLNHHKEVWR